MTRRDKIPQKDTLLQTFVLGALLLQLPLLLGGCTTLRELTALSDVEFSLENVRDIQLAGVRMDGIRSYDDLTVMDLAKLGSSLAREKMPLSFVVRIGAANPADNRVSARLVRFDWTLFLEDRETVSGRFEDVVELRPGVPESIPLTIDLDLLDFFGSSLTDLAELGLSLAGQGGSPKNVSLEATPTIDTAIGPIRYPEPIRIISRSIGG